MKNQKQLYEGMYILNAALSEEAIKKAIERITSAIEAHGGEIQKIHDQGKRKLAYEINGHRQGYYLLIFFSSFSNKIKELWDEYQLNEDLIRFMTLKTEKVLEKLDFKSLSQG